MDDLNMLDPVAAVAGTNGLSRRLVAIKRAPDPGIANGMNADLETAFFASNADFVELIGGEQNLSL